ncbi:MAG: PIN domain-containing protein, partial [Caulobacterales bacterium]|nr:PIN domain-containing protein [Caulobacterales bacterium]
MGARQRGRMETVFPEALVADYEGLIESIELPDADDRHVVAAAIQTTASLIVTENLRDFPNDRLRPHALAAIALDDFLADLLDLAG